MTNPTRYYLLGAAIAAFDRDLRKFTPSCVENLLRNPGRAAIVLRHQWYRMQSGRCGELLGRIDWPEFRTRTEDFCSFWLGYYHERAGTEIETCNPGAWAILHPEQAAV